MSALEKVAERAFVKWIKEETADETRKFKAARDDPDQQVLCAGGRTFFIEFKRIGGKPPRRGQLRRAKELTDLGFVVLFLFTCDEAIEYYHKFKRGEI